MFDAADARIATIARRQHGAFNRRQAIGAGMTQHRMNNRISSGAWVRLDNGVFALATHPSTWHRQLMAATLTAPGTVASGKAAAALHGVEGFRRAGLEITVPRGQRGSSTRLAVVRSARHIERTVVDGIPCAPLARTLRDLAADLPPSAARVAVESALVQRLASLDVLRSSANHPSASRMRGGVQLRRILLDLAGDGPAIPTSVLERRLRQLLSDPSLPPFAFEVEVPWWPPGIARVDAICASARLIVEADGRRWHTREQNFDSDRRRDNLAVSHGHVAIRFVADDLMHDLEPSRAMLKAVIDSRGQI